MQTKTIQSFDNYFLANITLSKLQSEGIKCYLVDEHSVTINPMYSNALGGIKLVVAEKDFLPASALLKQFHDEYMKSATCPLCGLNEITLVEINTPANVFTKLITWFFGSYGVAAESIYQCQSCSFESKKLPDSKDVEFGG